MKLCCQVGCCFVVNLSIYCVVLYSLIVTKNGYLYNNYASKSKLDQFCLIIQKMFLMNEYEPWNHQDYVSFSFIPTVFAFSLAYYILHKNLQTKERNNWRMNTRALKNSSPERQRGRVIHVTVIPWTLCIISVAKYRIIFLVDDVETSLCKLVEWSV